MLLFLLLLDLSPALRSKTKKEAQEAFNLFVKKVISDAVCTSYVSNSKRMRVLPLIFFAFHPFVEANQQLLPLLLLSTKGGSVQLCH